MIVVHISPAGIEQVYFQSNSELAEDLCLAIWPVVREELNHLHKTLRKEAEKTLKIVEREGL